MFRCRSVVCASFVLVACVVPLISTASAQDNVIASGGSEMAFKEWLVSLDDDAVTVTTESVVYEAEADILTIGGMKLTFSPIVPEANSASDPTPIIMSLKNVQLTGFSTSADGLSFQSATVQGITVNSGSAAESLVTAASLGLENVFLPSVRAFVADPRRPISSQIAFLRLLSTARADAISVSKLNVGVGFTAEKVQLSAFARGALQAAEFTEVALGQQEANTPAVDNRRFMASVIRISNVDLDPYLRLFEASAYLDAGSARPWRNLIEKLVISGLAVESSGTSIVSDLVTLDALKVRQFPENITNLFDQAAVDPAFLNKNQENATKFTASIRDAFAVESISVGPSTATARNSQGDLKIAAAYGRIAGISANRIEEISLDKPSYVDTLRSLQAKTLQFVGIILPQQIGGESSGTTPDVAPQVAAVKLSDFQGKIGEAQFALGQFDLAMSYFVGSSPTNVKMSLQALRIGVNQIAAPIIRDTLIAVGYKNVDLSISLAGSWQERSSEIALESVALAVAGLGELSASGSLTGVTRAGVEDPATSLSAELAAGGLKNFRLTFRNETFVQRLITQIAKQNGRTEDEIKKALASNMPGIMSSVTPSAIKNKLIFAGVSFLNDPRTLDFVSSTADAVSWSDIVGAFSEPARLPGLLQLDVRANGRQ